ncbi:MAG: metal-dependent hydrolase [candidate division KSB1 bacterium]|nr:metal-dependent hydrolase [candidate division KSB1 bacterium]MDZ7319484.1 metal-dependent hydrolase [candidate division KSB1 bacterium]
MPTPIGHSLLTTAIYSGVNQQKLKRNWLDYLVCLFIGIFPDLDFIPGLILGTPSRFHHGFTHSLFFGIIIGTSAGLIMGWLRNQNWWRYAILFIAVYFSHLAADFFGVDTRFPYGAQLFWPFWQGYLLSPVPIFLDVYRSSSRSDFLTSLFNFHNLQAALVELLICCPIWLLIHFKNVSRTKRVRDAGVMNTN